MAETTSPVDVLAVPNWREKNVSPAQVMRAMRDQGEWSDQALNDINAAILRYMELESEAAAFANCPHSIIHRKRLLAALARVKEVPRG